MIAGVEFNKLPNMIRVLTVPRYKNVIKKIGGDQKRMCKSKRTSLKFKENC